MSDVPPMNISGLFSTRPELGEPEFVSEEFVRERNRYLCVCGEHFLKPPVMQLSCGHRICFAPCLDNLKHSLTGSKCPGGEEECNQVDVTVQGHVLPDVSSTRELARAIIWCSNRNNGCPEQMPWKALEGHLRKCSYTLIACRNSENGCQEKLPANLIEDHVSNCMYIMFICPYCGESLLKIHKANHDRECEAQQGRCMLSAIGCTFTADSVEDLQEHNCADINQHLDLFREEFERRKEGDQIFSEEILRIKQNLKLDDLLVKLKQSSIEVKRRLDPKLKSTQKVAGKNSETLHKIISLEQKFRLLKPLQETARKSENRLNKLESDAPVLEIPREISNKLNYTQDRFDQHDKTIREMDLKFQCVENTADDGVFIWKLTSYSEHKQRARDGEILSVYSQPFCSGRFGYKMCLRLYPNGDGLGKGSHISLYLVIMKGDMDALLPWPFKQMVNFTLLDQDTHRRHYSDSFRPDPTSASFHKPRVEMNVASGLPLFLEQAKVESQTYLKDDCIFIKADISTKIW